MTVFAGVNDQDRGGYGWPSDIPIDTPIAQCNRIIGERITNFPMRRHLPIRVRVARERFLGSLLMAPIDDRENIKLRTLRDQLAQEVFRYRASDHLAYEFHTTLAYPLAELSSNEEEEHQSIMKQHLAMIVDVAPVVELGIPEFCTFENMHRFEIRSFLRT